MYIYDIDFLCKQLSTKLETFLTRSTDDVENVNNVDKGSPITSQRRNFETLYNFTFY